MIGGHYVYQCGEVATVSVSANARPEKPYDEARSASTSDLRKVRQAELVSRLFNAFQQVDLSKNFYFRYVSYAETRRH